MVERLVVVDAAPVTYPPAFVEYAQAMRNADLSDVQRRADVDAQLAGAVPTPGTRAFLLQNLILDEAGARWRPNLPVIEAALPRSPAGRPVSKAVSTTGRRCSSTAGSRTTSSRTTGTRSRRYFPQVQYAEVAEAGHWVHAERLDDFLAALSPFLS